MDNSKLIEIGTIDDQVLPGISCIKGNKVFFENEEEQLYDVIVLATGFKSSVKQWLKVMAKKLIMLATYLQPANFIKIN